MSFWHRLNDRRTPLGKAFRTFYQVFLPLFLMSLLGFFAQVQEWASCVADCKPFPSPNPLGKALVAAFTAGLGAIVTYVLNLFEDRRADRQIIDAEPVVSPIRSAEITTAKISDGAITAGKITNATLVSARTSEGEEVIGGLEILDVEEDEDEGDLELADPVELVVVDDSLAAQPPDDWEVHGHDESDRMEGVEVVQVGSDLEPEGE